MLRIHNYEWYLSIDQRGFDASNTFCVHIYSQSSHIISINVWSKIHQYLLNTTVSFMEFKYTYFGRTWIHTQEDDSTPPCKWARRNNTPSTFTMFCDHYCSQRLHGKFKLLLKSGSSAGARYVCTHDYEHRHNRTEMEQNKLLSGCTVSSFLWNNRCINQLREIQFMNRKSELLGEGRIFALSLINIWLHIRGTFDDAFFHVVQVNGVKGCCWHMGLPDLIVSEYV